MVRNTINSIGYIIYLIECIQLFMYEITRIDKQGILSLPLVISIWSFFHS